MTWGIIAAMDEELNHILSEMQVEQTLSAYGTTYHIGTIDTVPVVAVRCSVGTINAAVCTSTLIRELGATRVVNIGVAGSTCEELSILDVVLGNELLFHDVQGDFLANFHPFCDRFTADPKLLELAEWVISRMEPKDFRYRVGRIATGDLFVQDPAVKEDIVRRCQPLCVEMEGAAVAQVAYLCDTPFLVIRSLSDDAGQEAQLSFEHFVEQAARNSAEIVLGMIRQSAEEGK
ncbi:MAG: 5'-methylthioadenosine/adenosylhomocysteine nucleosidase [Oscillospiraceae bacterium]|jgi:adenosylhomocysteine nucleosidase